VKRIQHPRRRDNRREEFAFAILSNRTGAFLSSCTFLLVDEAPLTSLETETETERERERERERRGDDNVRTALANPRCTYCADSVSRGCSLRRAENFAVRGRSLSRSFVARAPSGIASRLNSRIREREREARRGELNRRSAHLSFCFSPFPSR